MATITYFVDAKKREIAPIYVRLLAGRKVDLTVRTALFVNPDRWSNKTQTIKQRITTDEDDKLILKLKGLKSQIETEFKNCHSDYSKDWLEEIINRFHNGKDAKAKNLNEYIDQFIREAKAGTRKNKSSVNIAPGTIRIWEGFKRIFGIYQGIYSEKDLKEIENKNIKLKQENKPLIKLRPLKKLDFQDINVDFYNSFVNFLTNEGYAMNTMGRFIKSLKLIMKKALEVDKLHTNQEFKYEAFKGITEKTFAIYLTKDELNKIYNKDLTKFPRMDLARDAFIILCETCLRISDYSKIEINIRTIEGKRFIDILQTKTGTQVIIPLTQRFESIWKKYGNKLPRIPEQHVNRYIKTIGLWCEITEEIRWEGVKFGKKYQKSAKKYELITCHTGRRTACTNMYLAGIPLKDIREISGHSSDKQLLEYIRISKEETALRLAEHPYYSGLKVVS
jgi:site-specific recombinase XerD